MMQMTTTSVGLSVPCTRGCIQPWNITTPLSYHKTWEKEMEELFLTFVEESFVFFSLASFTDALQTTFIVLA
ncbi:Protein of unknown function [Pyronema omphalodes CBS 100304]|uniref:Uncharacterized protein n=1 Tax=Pyronema omphalodes (strain CBS 100304) TaxID=1076935 RepID=U4LLN7_PYROM|nr:Protein of unknown function [Pyronema omphalodes CBS 100304]